MFIEIFTKDNCLYCNNAKKLLKFSKLEFVERNISDNERYKQSLLERIPGVKTVPQIFINRKHIGGYEDLVKYLEST